MKKAKVYLFVNCQCNGDWKSDPIIETYGFFDEADDAFALALRELYNTWVGEYGEENIAPAKEGYDFDKYVVNYIYNDEEDGSLPSFEIYDVRNSVQKYQKIYIEEREISVPEPEKAISKDSKKENAKKPAKAKSKEEKTKKEGKKSKKE